jgi:flagellar assembly factor FliW
MTATLERSGMSDAAGGFPQDQVLHFEDGIPGFPECRSFALVDLADDSAFQLLQSIDQTEVAMVVAVPWLFFPEYSPELSEMEQQELAIHRAEDAVIFCPVTLDKERDTVYFNLLGPFVVNAETRKGRQLVLTDSEYPVRAAVNLADN